MQAPPPEPGRPPQLVLPGLWLFAPSRDTQGGSSWLLEAAHSGLAGDLLVDCPGYSQANLDWLRARPLGGTVVMTSREGHGRCRRLQEAIGWDVLVQEQEAYLLPGVSGLRRFGAESRLAPGVALLWTPGPTPGAAVLHVAGPTLNVLFCGRLLLPVGPGALAPLRTARTFHWPRQLRSLARLRRWLPEGSPHWIACGGGLGALRGQKLVAGGAALLAGLDLEEGLNVPAGPLGARREG
ncbi:MULTISPECIES: MBL fold metallo-hydrolase [Aphanothece]|uniref:MBL fold metallo-hydrolase n=1 Tax=Aphanothece TaxID=1121 RepID=UPI00398F4806